MNIFHIAELSGNHNNSIEIAFELVEKFSQSGASAIKLQTFKPDTITIKSNRPEFKIKGGLWDGYTLFDLYSKSSMPWEWQKEIGQIIKLKGLKFISSPFDYSAVDFLIDIKVDVLKVASPEIIDLPLIKYMGSTGKPLIISTGMATITEISNAVDAAYAGGANEVTLLKCTSAYPSKVCDMNLGAIPKLKEIFGLPVGLSDHSLGGLAASIAVTLGARTIEKHVVLDRNAGGIDSNFSMEPHEYSSMIQDTESTYKSLGDHVGPIPSENIAIKHRRSLYIIKKMKAGDIITSEHIKSFRPGIGLEPKFFDFIIGMKVNRDVDPGEPLLREILL
jgi:N-acetylneuraminate synthase